MYRPNRKSDSDEGDFSISGDARLGPEIGIIKQFCFSSNVAR
jgi:hypothetical protein